MTMSVANFGKINEGKRNTEKSQYRFVMKI